MVIYTLSFGLVVGFFLVSMIYQAFKKGNQGEEKIERQLMMLKLFYADRKTRFEIMGVVKIFGLRVVDRMEEHCLTIEVTGSPVKIEAVLKSFRKFKIISIKKTSKITFERAQPSGFEPHTICILMKDSPESLCLITKIISQARCNIQSLAFGPAEKGFIRITTVVTGEYSAALAWEFDNLEIVSEVRDITGHLFADYESMLIKVVLKADTKRRFVLNIASIFRAEAVASPVDDTMMIILQFTGDSNKLTSLVKALEPYGTCEVARSGPLALNEHTLYGGLK